MNEIDLHQGVNTEPVSAAKTARSGLQRGDLIHRITSSGSRVETFRITALSEPHQPWLVSMLAAEGLTRQIGRDVAGGYATDDGQTLDAPVRIARTSYLLRNIKPLIGRGAHRVDGVGGKIVDISMDKLNPWLIVNTGSTLLRLTPEAMDGWVLSGTKGIALIEAVYGTKRIPRDTVIGLLVHDSELGVYGAVQHMNTTARTASVWMLDGSGVWQHLDESNAGSWKVVGTTKTVMHLLIWTKDAGLPVSAKAPVTARSLSERRNFAIAGGTFLGMFIGAVPAIVLMTPELTSLAVVGALPYLEHRLWTHLRLRGVYAGEDAQAQLPALGSNSTVGTGLINRLREQLRIEMPSAQKEIATRILGTGSYLLTHLDTLAAPVREETSALLLDHLPKALKLYAAATEHQLSPSSRVEATELLGRQLSQIDAALDATRAQIEGQVMRQLREHANFLDAKLRKSDLD